MESPAAVCGVFLYPKNDLYGVHDRVLLSGPAAEDPDLAQTGKSG